MGKDDEYRPQSKEEEIVRRCFLLTLMVYKGPDRPTWKEFWAAYNAQKSIDVKANPWLMSRDREELPNGVIRRRKVQ